MPAETPRPKANKKRLPVAEVERSPVGCLECALCCTYIAVGIDGPRNAKAATEILWHLYHRDVSIYCDGDNEWMVQFESRCRHLLADNRCAIYETRPHICRDYSEKSCEVNSEGEGMTFYTPAEFLAYLERKKKRVYRAIRDKYVPNEEHLGNGKSAPRRGPNFETRFKRLRALGQRA